MSSDDLRAAIVLGDVDGVKRILGVSLGSEESKDSAPAGAGAGNSADSEPPSAGGAGDGSSSGATKKRRRRRRGKGKGKGNAPGNAAAAALLNTRAADGSLPVDVAAKVCCAMLEVYRDE